MMLIIECLAACSTHHEHLWLALAAPLFVSAFAHICHLLLRGCLLNRDTAMKGHVAVAARICQIFDDS